MSGPHSDAVKNLVLDPWATGKKWPAIHAVTGLSQNQIHYIVKIARLAGDARATSHPAGCDAVWTDEMVSVLRRMWAAGKSCTAIAAAIGPEMTKNSVISKAHRIGLPRHANKQAVARKPRAGKAEREYLGTGPVGAARRARQASRKKLGEPGREQRIETKPVAILAPRVNKLEMPVSRNVPLLDLSPADCRYPGGEGTETTFCGCRRWNSLPYCEYHARLCYLPGSSVLGLRKARQGQAGGNPHGTSRKSALLSEAFT